MSKENGENLIKEEFEQMETDEEENEHFKQKRKIYIIKGISSILSCIFYTFGCFSFWSLGNATVYLISFRRFYNQKLTFSY